MTEDSQAAARSDAAGAPRRTVLVSACLLGVPCRHDGRDRLDPSIREKARGVVLVPVCPEELGGLGTPRPAAELRGGDGNSVLDGHARVETFDGRDVTKEFVAGANRAVAIGRAVGAEEAWLTERSPSCGSRGTHVDGRLVPGSGVASAALVRAGLVVVGVGDPTKSGRAQAATSSSPLRTGASPS